jgi:hypothetical protein
VDESVAIATHGSTGGGLRVSDADRDQAAREIREHYAVGRLDEEELNERLEAVYAARTDADLAAIQADLPRLPASRSAELAAMRARRRDLQRRLLQQSGGGLGLFAVCSVIWLAGDTHGGSFWPVWILVVVVVPLLRNSWRLYGPAPELDRVEAELERRERHAERRSRHAQRRARRHR